MPSGGPYPDGGNSLTEVFVKTDTGWRIAQGHNTPINREAAAHDPARARNRGDILPDVLPRSWMRQPGTLANLCQNLVNRGINILVQVRYPERGSGAECFRNLRGFEGNTCLPPEPT